MRFVLLAATALTTTITFLVPGVGFAQSTYDWSGAYVGLNAGIVQSRAPVTIDGTDEYPVHATGGLLGVTAGYNLQMGGVVLGIEADANTVKLKGERDDAAGEFTTELESLLTLRGRLGFSSGQALFYGTAGLAAGQASFTATPGDLFIPDTAAASAFVRGPVVGAGVEFALTDNLSVKTEGLYYSLAPLTAVADNGKSSSYESEYAASGFAVRTGVNFRF